MILRQRHAPGSSLGGRAARRLLRATAARWPARWLITRVNLVRNRGKVHRKLEIGAGGDRSAGFETLDIAAGTNIDYIADATRRLPFPDDTFEVVYASHVLEHLPWYRLEQTLQEWVRVLAPGGWLEIWVPNGLEICRVFVDYETTGEDRTDLDGWYRFNPDHDPCRWAAGRIFTYGDGKGTAAGPNWHRSLFSPRFLGKLLAAAGLQDVQTMDRTHVRGEDHGWINLGMRGRKP